MEEYQVEVQDENESPIHVHYSPARLRGPAGYQQEATADIALVQNGGETVTVSMVTLPKLINVLQGMLDKHRLSEKVAGK